uniref:Junction adhesion molecule like n=1 Tax=Jaculus jaculus TaxID=51337 RepID=A0A8C5NVG4_JACJA
MFYLLKLLLCPLVDYSRSGNDFTVSIPELRVPVGDSALLGCVFQNLEEKRVVKVDWILSPQNEYVLYYYANFSVPLKRFQNRAHLVGDLLHNDGSLFIQNLQEADQGNYTCEIRREGESRVLKKSVVLHVLPEEPKELTIHVGDSTMMGCVFQSTEKKQMTKVDWMFSSAENEEIVFYYDIHSSGFRGYPRKHSRFWNRVNLLGDISHNNGSIMLRGVKRSDQGDYTCSIHLGNLVFRKTFVLHVIHAEVSETPGICDWLGRPEVLNGNQVVIIVGIVCSSLVLLPVLILIVKRTSWNKSSVNSTAIVKSLENTKKVNPEKHVYSSITTREVMEEEPRGQSEATYMTMVRTVLASSSALPEVRSK